MTAAIHPTTVPNHFGSYGELDALCKLIREEKVLLWVGSGFSSYAGYPTGTQLPSIMLSSLGELQDGAPNAGSASLQEAADYYVKQKGRSGLNTLLIEHYGKEPSRCDAHKSLALINRVKYIVTTNYDPVFERAYKDRIVVISRDEQLPGSTEYPDKTILLKIHGDITQPDTIVITSEDYKKFDSDKIVWSKIRSLLAEYSVVFIGYSLHDPNVEKMLGDVYARLKGKKHPYFFVSRKIDDAKREDLASYDLHFIEMDAVSAIEYVAGNAIEYSFVDGMKKPSLFTKSDPIFTHQGFRVDRQISGGKVTHLSLVPMQPNAEIKFTLSLASKSGTDAPLLSFQNFITGQSLEPVKLSEEECDIDIRDGKMNGVFVFDPSNTKIHEIQIKPHASEVLTADLRLQNHPTKLSNLPLKIYKTESLLKLKIQDPDFTLSLTLTRGSREGTVNFSSRHIISDIERARTIYTFFNSWIQGDTIELLMDRLPAPFLIQSTPVVERIPDNLPISNLCQLYTDLSDIQNILKVKLLIQDSITLADQKVIRHVSAFIRGKSDKIDVLSTTFGNTEQIRNLVKKNEPSPFRIEGNGDKLLDEYQLFGKTLCVRFVIDGSDVVVANADEVLTEIERGDEELHLNWKSVTGEFYKKFEQPNAAVKKLPDVHNMEESR